MIIRLHMLVLALLCCLGSIAVAQAPAPAPPVDEEEQMDAALRKFGYASGHACQCQPQQADRTRLERQALDIATGILRLFGSDRAFYYAAAFGAGVTAKVDRAGCAAAVKEYEAMLARMKTLAAR